MNDREQMWPNVVVVGAGRCGTTAIHRFLSQHPEIAVCQRKSPNYFVHGIAQPEWETATAVAMASHWVTDAEEYWGLFDSPTGTRVRVDVSPIYLQALGVAERIHHVNPHALIVAILRDPAERAFAHFLGRRRDGIEQTPTFGEWLDTMVDRPLPDEVAFGHYVGCGRYHHFLRPYIEIFGRDRVVVLFHDDLLRDPTAVMRSLFSAVGARHDVEIALSTNHNRSGEIVNPVLRRLWLSTVSLRTKLRPILPERWRSAVGRRILSNLERDELKPEWRRRVVVQLEQDIRQLEDLIEVNLAHWYE